MASSENAKSKLEPTRIYCLHDWRANTSGIDCQMWKKSDNTVYHVRGALQEKVYGSANILITVVESYHALILVLPSNFHQLWKGTNAMSEKLLTRHWYKRNKTTQDMHDTPFKKKTQKKPATWLTLYQHAPHRTKPAVLGSFLLF